MLPPSSICVHKIVDTTIGRRDIPERWFCIRFWAVDTMHKMVTHRPQFAQILLQEDAVSVFEALLNPQLDHELSGDLSRLKIRRHQIPFVSSKPSPTFPSHSGTSSIESSLQFSFEYLSCTPLIRPPSAGDDHERHVIEVIRRDITYSHSGTTSDPGTPIPSRRNSSVLPSLSLRSRLRSWKEWPIEDYKVHTIKRTKDLSEYIRKWTEHDQKSPPRLEVLDVGTVWLSGWEKQWAV